MKKNRFLFYVLAFWLPGSAFGELQKNWEIVTVDNEAVYFLTEIQLLCRKSKSAGYGNSKIFVKFNGFRPNPYLLKWIMIARNLGNVSF